MTDALLIYPRLGSLDSMVMDLPLSIMYAAAESVKRGYDVRCLDMRAEPGDWKEALRKAMSGGARLVGISVMTGSPLSHAREMSRFVREEYPGVPVVWGGPHVTVMPETIEEPFVDILVRGYGSRTLAELIACLREGGSLDRVKGISFKRGGKPVHIPRETSHEMIPYRELPYDLVDIESPAYVRSYSGKRLFPIFSSIGCPYNCSFCVHPTVYREINGPKWLPYPDEEILDHIELVMGRYHADHIVFIDDTSFPNIPRMRRLFEGVLARGLKLTMEFRGARINEIDRMDDDFLDLMVRAGGRAMMVGVESGSDRVLKSFQKGITKKQILDANRKLARHPQITPYYNFIYGTPGERYEDLVETKNVVLELLKDNPQAYFGFGGDWKPVPGTRTLEIAEKEYGFVAPKTMDDWIEMDSVDSKEKIRHSWYTTPHDNLIKLMQVASFVIDDKIIKESRGNDSLSFRFYRLASRLYKPLAKFRLEHDLHQFLIEYEMWRLLVRLIAKLKSAG